MTSMAGTVRETDLVLVNRGGVDYQTEAANLGRHICELDELPGPPGMPWEGATAIYHVILPDASTTMEVAHYERVYERQTGTLLAENPDPTKETAHVISGPAEAIITYDNSTGASDDGLRFDATGDFSFGDLTDTSKVKTFRSLFHGCGGFTGSLQLFDTSNVEDMSYMFYRCSKFASDLSHFDMSKVKTTYYMFRNCSNFTQPVHMWNMSSLEKADEMFLGAARMYQDLSGWCVPNISSSSDVFGLTLMENKVEYHPIWGTCPIAPSEG